SAALKENDLAAVQAAFAALKKDDPNLSKKLSEHESAKSNPLNSLAAALDKGDLSAAQTALASLKKGHLGHHRQPASIDSSSGSVSSMTADIMGTSTTGTVIDVKV